MELRTLRYFVEVAEHGSITAASSVVHVSQPSLSRQLRHLERDLGLTLFTRSPGSFVLSPGGRAFVPIARDLLAQADAVRSRARTIAAGTLTSLTVSAPEVTLTDILAPFCATLDVEDPMPHVLISRDDPEYTELDRGVDLVIGTRIAPPHLAARPLPLLGVFAYGPPGHTLELRSSVTVEELAEYPLLLPSTAFHARRALDAAMDRAQVACQSVTELSSSHVAQALAASGRGVAVVSDDPRYGLVPVPVTGPFGPLRIHLYAGWSRTHPAHDEISRFAGRVAAFVAQRYAGGADELH